MDKETYQKSLRKFQRLGYTRPTCFFCCEDDPRTLELHHYEGRAISDELVLACKNCHAKNSAEQNKVSPKVRSANASPKQKEGYYFVTIGTFLEVLGSNLKEYGFSRCDLESGKNNGHGVEL